MYRLKTRTSVSKTFVSLRDFLYFLSALHIQTAEAVHSVFDTFPAAVWPFVLTKKTPDSETHHTAHTQVLWFQQNASHSLQPNSQYNFFLMIIYLCCNTCDLFPPNLIMQQDSITQEQLRIIKRRGKFIYEAHFTWLRGSSKRFTWKHVIRTELRSVRSEKNQKHSNSYMSQLELKAWGEQKKIYPVWGSSKIFILLCKWTQQVFYFVHKPLTDW